MPDAIGLNIIGITRGHFDSKNQFYIIELEDDKGQIYFTSVSCRLLHKDYIDKAFSRLLMNDFLPIVNTSVSGGENGRKEN